jgi:hypothetical protein
MLLNVKMLKLVLGGVGAGTAGLVLLRSIQEVGAFRFAPP